MIVAQYFTVLFFCEFGYKYTRNLLTDNSYLDHPPAKAGPLLCCNPNFRSIIF